MKVHKITFEEMDKPGCIWAAVSVAKHEHQLVMRYKRTKQWSLEDFCRTSRNTMMRTIRLIARGMLGAMNRNERKINKTHQP